MTPYRVDDSPVTGRSSPELQQELSDLVTAMRNVEGQLASKHAWAQANDCFDYTYREWRARTLSMLNRVTERHGHVKAEILRRQGAENS